MLVRSRRKQSLPIIPMKKYTMTAPGRQFKTIDEYIGTFPPEVRKILGQLRETIHEAAPEAGEAIKYRIPTFTLNGNLVHFAAFEHHIGFYPTPSAIEAFKSELSQYKTAKGSIQFPIDEPIPFDLVKRMVHFRVMEILDGRKKKSQVL